MEDQVVVGVRERMTNKECLLIEREIDKLNRSIGVINDLTKLPDALFVVDVGYHAIAVAEAHKLGIPVIGVVDTNNSPEVSLVWFLVTMTQQKRTPCMRVVFLTPSSKGVAAV